MNIAKTIRFSLPKMAMENQILMIIQLNAHLQGFSSNNKQPHTLMVYSTHLWWIWGWWFLLCKNSPCLRTLQQLRQLCIAPLVLPGGRHCASLAAGLAWSGSWLWVQTPLVNRKIASECSSYMHPPQKVSVDVHQTWYHKFRPIPHMFFFLRRTCGSKQAKIIQIWPHQKGPTWILFTAGIWQWGYLTIHSILRTHFHLFGDSGTYWFIWTWDTSKSILCDHFRHF